MSQTFFVWPHGGKSVSLAGTFNHWHPQPLIKQGNYFFGVLDLADGVYQYKFVVDGRWVYDISQIHSDDGSGNWNNEIEVGKAAVVHKEHISQPAPKQQQQHQQQQKQHQQHQQPAQEHQGQQGQQGQQKSKKQLKKEQAAERQQQQGGQQQQKGKQQQQQKGKKPEPEPEPAAEPEPQPEPEAAAEPEAEAEAEPEAQVEAEVEAEAEEAAAETETPQVEEKKPEKVLISLITLEIVGQQDVDMAELEKHVRSVQRPGLKWEGSAVKDHFFGLQKLEIICQVRDDVAVEDDVLVEIQQNEELVSGASIISFAC